MKTWTCSSRHVPVRLPNGMICPVCDLIHSLNQYGDLFSELAPSGECVECGSSIESRCKECQVRRLA